MPNYTDREYYPDAVVFRVAELFLIKRLMAKDVAAQVTREYVFKGRITRETVYDVVSEAVQRQFMRLVPPTDKQLAQRLQEKYPNIIASKTHVVDMVGPQDDDKVAKVAAELAFNLLPEIREGCPTRPVGIGLGPGRATRDFCLHFSRILHEHPDAPPIRLVAITGGGPAYSPEFASTSFFNLFPRHLFNRGIGLTECDRLQIGLFAGGLVLARDHDQIKTWVGVREAVAAVDMIDLVVTAMGDINDPHDLLARSIAQQSDDNLNKLRNQQGVVGNIQYRPYSKTHAIEEDPDDWRAVTLFEIKDLVRLAAQRHKHVILIARQCGMCGTSRARAIEPLVSLPHMKAFSHLVVDTKTVTELLQDLPVATSPPTAPAAVQPSRNTPDPAKTVTPSKPASSGSAPRRSPRKR